jgi:5-methylcytosine-specific restriction enzyme A
MLRPAVGRLDTRTAKPPTKTADPLYSTPAHKAFRDAVIARAGGRCEWVENGMRCDKAAPQHRMFADHKVEVQDDGAKFDPANGQCLCGKHHSIKTHKERVKRTASPA